MWVVAAMNRSLLTNYGVLALAAHTCVLARPSRVDSTTRERPRGMSHVAFTSAREGEHLRVIVHLFCDDEL